MVNLFFSILLSVELFGSLDTTKVTKEPPIHSLLYQKTTYTLNSDYSLSQQMEKVITVMNPEGLSHAKVILMYDKLQEITNFELDVVDPLTGKTIRKARLRDMGDVASSSSDFLLDNRFKFYEVTSSTYPVVVKVKTEILRKTNFYYPSWVPVAYNNQKVKESELVFHYPTKMGLNYKELNLAGTKETKQEGGMTTVIWKELDLQVQTPRFDPEQDPKIFLSPVQFAINDFQGEMNDWSGLAAWQHRLNQGRDKLPEDFKLQIRELVKGESDPYQKIAILYDHLQRNYRYVSIQLGIGGWQTMTAQEVVENKYGDCKALTNLMKAMLEEVGIPSHYTLIQAGKGAKDIQVDFPSIQFNHVILQVPTQSQPIWLECTSTLNPPGFLGSFTSDRHALVTTPSGGYLTKTPNYSAASWNTITTQSKLILDSQGMAQIESVLQSQGNEAMNARQVNSLMDDREKRDYLNKSSAVAGLIVQEFSILNDRKDSIPTSEIKYKGIIQRFTQATSKRIILRPFLARITENQLFFNTLEREDRYEIQLSEELQLEGGSDREMSFEGEGYQGKLIFSQSGKVITVLRTLSLHLDQVLKEEDKTSLLIEINSKFDQTITFIKPTLSTLNDE